MTFDHFSTFLLIHAEPFDGSATFVLKDPQKDLCSPPLSDALSESNRHYYTLECLRIAFDAGSPWPAIFFYSKVLVVGFETRDKTSL